MAVEVGGPRAHRGRSVERQCAVRLVLGSVARDRAGRKRQRSVAPVVRLNGGLLVDAEHCGMTGRVQVETDDVSGLRLDVGVVRRHIAGQPVWPHVRLAPDPLYDVLVHAEMGRETAARPVRRSRPAAGGVWRLARERAAAPPTSTAAGSGDRLSGPPRRAAGTADATWR